MDVLLDAGFSFLFFSPRPLTDFSCNSLSCEWDRSVLRVWCARAKGVSDEGCRPATQDVPFSSLVPRPHPLGDDKTSLLPTSAPPFVLGIFIFPKGKPNRDPPPCSCYNNYRKQQTLFHDSGGRGVRDQGAGERLLRELNELELPIVPSAAEIETEDFPTHTPPPTQMSYYVGYKAAGLKQSLIQERKANVCVHSRARRAHMLLIECVKVAAPPRLQRPRLPALQHGLWAVFPRAHTALLLCGQVSFSR